MKSSVVLSLAATASVALGAPTDLLQTRAAMCGQWDSTVTGPYTLYNNLWGKGSATSGSQCITLDSASGNNIAWNAAWSWAGGSGQVKSYPNVVTKFTPKKLSALSSVQSSWSWSYTGSGIIADVSYDLFTSSTAGGSNENEIMIWLDALGGAFPISATGSPVATTTLAGTSWKLYKGMNGQTTVYSFVANGAVNSFRGDINDFLKFLTAGQGLDANQYLTSIGAGTEPFEGSNAVFKTTGYSVVVQ